MSFPPPSSLLSPHPLSLSTPQWPKLLSEPRSGKKLLVLDIDYTLFDHVSPAETAAELARPCESSGACTALHDMKWCRGCRQEAGKGGHLLARDASAPSSCSHLMQSLC